MVLLDFVEGSSRKAFTYCAVFSGNGVILKANNITIAKAHMSLGNERSRTKLLWVEIPRRTCTFETFDDTLRRDSKVNKHSRLYCQIVHDITWLDVVVEYVFRMNED